MATTIRIDYEGGLRSRATHGPSGTQITVDAPPDNHGRGESFSPTDLVATALGACVVTLMGIVAERHGIDLQGTTVTVEKHMVADPDRRIGALPVVVRAPASVPVEKRALLERAGLTCPVMRSLGERVEKTVRFEWV